jgi:hypothetical protein
MWLINIFMNNLSQALDHFFGVLLVPIGRSPLVTRLRPSADLDAMHLLSIHVLRANRVAQSDYEDARRVRIREHRGVAWIKLVEFGQQIQMRPAVGRDVVAGERIGHLNGLEESLSAVAGKKGDSVRGRGDFIGRVRHDSLGVKIKALKLGRAWHEGPGKRLEIPDEGKAPDPAPVRAGPAQCSDRRSTPGRWRNRIPTALRETLLWRRRAAPLSWMT